jgi:hypothetical protein
VSGESTQERVQAIYRELDEAIQKATTDFEALCECGDQHDGGMLTDWVIVTGHQGIDDDGSRTSRIKLTVRGGDQPGYTTSGLLAEAASLDLSIEES